MRRAWYWMLPLFLGCSGQNVVAGEEKTKQQQLADSLPTWCQQLCGTLRACNEGRPCDCTGDTCSCVEVDVEECAANCQKELRKYTLGGEECADLGQGFKGCLEKLSCGELLDSGESDCAPTKAQRAVCPPDDDPPMADLPTSVGGTTSTAGSASVSHGTAGSAAVGGSPGAGGTGPALPVSCEESYGAGGSSAGGTAALVCDEGRLGCSDGHEYGWLCARGASSPLVCSCLVDGQLTRGFDPEGGACPALERVNAACGFGLER